MSLIVKESGSTFIPAPEGAHSARCYAIIDLGEQKSEMYNNSARKISIGFELPDKLMPDGRPFTVQQRYTASLGSKAKLRGLLEQWRGKGFTADELKGFDLKNILGQTCYLTIKHTQKTPADPVYANITGASMLPKGFKVPAAFNEKIFFSLDHYTDADFNKVPERIREKINLSTSQANVEQPKSAQRQQNQNVVDEDEDDGIPF